MTKSRHKNTGTVTGADTDADPARGGDGASSRVWHLLGWGAAAYYKKRMYGADDLLGDDPRREFERLLVTRCRAGDAFALMLVDLDGFATVSARFGALAADLLLYEVASRLREMLNEQDVVMRSGSGEFAIFIRGMEQVQNAERLANELIERVERPITVSGTRFSLSASIGITLSPRQSGEWRLLLQDADEAVYDAKKQGRGHISISSAPPRKADA